MTVRSAFAPALSTLALLATGACGISPTIVVPPPLVDGVETAPLDELPPVAREFFEAFGPINDSRPTTRGLVTGTGVYEGRSVIGSDGGALFAFGDARMVVDFASGGMTARLDNFRNHDADGVPTEALSGALEVANGRKAGWGFWGDISGQLTGATDAFDVSGSVEGAIGQSDGQVMAGRVSGTVTGSETGSVAGLFYGNRR